MKSVMHYVPSKNMRQLLLCKGVYRVRPFTFRTGSAFLRGRNSRQNPLELLELLWDHLWITGLLWSTKELAAWYQHMGSAESKQHLPD